MKKFLAIVVGGAGIFLGYLSFGSDTQKDMSVVPDVTIYRANENAAQREHFFGATVKNVDEVILSAQVGGTVSEVLVEEGDKVKSGQVLVQINADEYNAQYAQMRIALESAEQAEKLARRNWDDLKPEEREQQKLESERLRAMVAESSAHLRKLRVVAPFDGIVSSKFISKGAVTSAGTNLVRLVGDGSKKKIVVNVPIALGEEVEVGDEVSVSDGKKSEDAKVSSINPVANTQTRKIEINIEMPTDSSFGLGSFVDARFLIRADDGGVRVPFEAVVRDYDDNFVFIVGQDSVVSMQKVDVLSIEAEHVVVSSVDDGARVVVGGAHTLFDKDTVNVVGDIK